MGYPIVQYANNTKMVMPPHDFSIYMKDQGNVSRQQVLLPALD
jgi:hypothetical protein